MPAGMGGSLKWPVTAQPVFSTSSTQYHPIGTRGEDRFGRVFRYCLAGGTTLVAGNCLQAPAQLADHQDMTPSAAAIDDKTISVTPGATAGAADLYAGGIAVIDTTPGLGYSYPVNTHLAITASTLFVLQLAAGWTIQVALTATSRVSLYSNPYANVIQTPVTTLTNIVVGACVYPITNAQYGWVGVHGHFGTLIQGTPAVANSLSCPATAAGAAAINSGTLPIIGTIMDTGQDGKVEGVFWLL